MESRLFQDLAIMGSEQVKMASWEVRRWLIFEIGLVALERWHDFLINSLARIWQVQVTRSLHERYFSELTFYHSHGINACDRIATDVPAMTHELAQTTCGALSIFIRFVAAGVHLFRRAPKPWVLRWQVGASVVFSVVYMSLWALVSLRCSPLVGWRHRRQRKQDALEASYRRHNTRIAQHCEAIAGSRGEQHEEQQMQSRLAAAVDHGFWMLPVGWLL